MCVVLEYLVFLVAALAVCCIVLQVRPKLRKQTARVLTAPWTRPSKVVNFAAFKNSVVIGQLSLAIPPSVGAMSTSRSWGVCRHTVRGLAVLTGVFEYTD